MGSEKTFVFNVSRLKTCSFFLYQKNFTTYTHIADHLWTNGRNRRHCIVLALNGKKNQECTRVQPVQPSGPTLQYFAHQFMELFWINITSKRSSTTNTVLRCYQLWTNFSIQHFVWSDHNLVAVYNKHWWLMNDQTHWCMNKILGSCYSMRVY